MYRYDLHVHTKEVSPCGKLTVEETVDLYKAKGYDGFWLTNHFHREFFERTKGLTWEQRVEAFFLPWREGKKYAGEDFFIGQGMELRFLTDPNDYLLFGITEELLLAEDIGLTGEAADEILKFIAIQGDNGQVLTALEDYRGRNERFDQGLDELTTVVKYLAAFGVPEDHFAVDLTIARGLDYYTGTVYETTMLDHPEIGSICSGGRYDNLAEYYTDKQLPGVGISIGLTRLFYVLSEQGMLNGDMNTAPTDVLILPMTDDLSPAISFASRLRQAGIRTQLYTEQKKFKQKMSYADKLGVPYVVFLGEDEVRQGAVSVKDMISGEQNTLPLDQAVVHMKNDLAVRAALLPIREPDRD